jgi:threonine/homoserine/homoserine lactone efflux protein
VTTLGFWLALTAVVGLCWLVYLGVRYLRRQEREAELLPAPRHQADAGADLNWWWLRDE